MTILRPLLFILLGLAISTVIDAGALYYAGKTPQGRAFIRDFLVSQNQAGVITQVSAASTTPPGILPVPQAYATQEYFVAINNVIQDLFAINTTKERAEPLVGCVDGKEVLNDVVDSHKILPCRVRLRHRQYARGGCGRRGHLRYNACLILRDQKVADKRSALGSFTCIVERARVNHGAYGKTE